MIAVDATPTTEYRAIVSWAGQGEPITLTLYAADGAALVLDGPLSGWSGHNQHRLRLHQ